MGLNWSGNITAAYCTSVYLIITLGFADKSTYTQLKRSRVNVWHRVMLVVFWLVLILLSSILAKLTYKTLVVFLSQEPYKRGNTKVWVVGRVMVKIKQLLWACWNEWVWWLWKCYLVIYLWSCEITIFDKNTTLQQ